MLIKRAHKRKKKKNLSLINLSLLKEKEFLLKPHTLKSLTTLAFIKHTKYSGSEEELYRPKTTRLPSYFYL